MCAEHGDNAGVHAVTSAGGQNYQYDKYGNMTQRGGDTIDYNVFNKPTRISGGGNITSIDYDANHDRFREVNGSTTTYTFAGGLYEEIVEGTKTTQKSYVDGVILNTKVFNSGLEASNDTLYLHTDNLGSVEAISDKLGAFVNRMSFSDWGKRQQSDWKTGSPAGSFPTANGYTGHHQLDQHKLVHMGGRVYDPGLGRFLSADLFVQSPYSSQSFNRYSYVANNPLSNVDPSGYECDKITSNAGTADEKVRYTTDTCGGGIIGGLNFGGGSSPQIIIEPLPLPDFSQQSGSFGLDYPLGYYLPHFSEDGYNFAGGLADTLSLGTGAAISEWFYGAPTFDKNSKAFKYGEYSGIVAGGLGGLGKGLLKEGVAKSVIGFAPGAAESALAGMRNGGGHAIRHLEGNLIPNTGSLQSRVDAFKALATPILENPVHAANWRIGATEGRAFLGNVSGQNLAIVVATDGPQQGKVISSFIPDSNQLSLILSR